MVTPSKTRSEKLDRSIIAKMWVGKQVMDVFQFFIKKHIGTSILHENGCTS
jgi:hypothetical protein